MLATAEHQRLHEHYAGQQNWLHWGPYLSERQWGTVREDYSPGGTAWDYFPHDHARSRVYRWGEDGIAGISDANQHLCFALALWNGRDPILKERLFGLTGSEGNHGEDVKELYYYLDSTPSHTYMKHLYKYPQAEFPYAQLVEENRRRGREQAEYELLDTGIFDENRYWDVFTEYAKAGPDDVLIRITAHNRGADPAPLWLLPTLWFRNLWKFGLMDEKPSISASGPGAARVAHALAGDFHFYFETPDRLLFTENEDNRERLWGQENASPFVKDAFHRAVTGNDFSFLENQTAGTKCAPMYQREVPAGGSVTIRLRLSKTAVKTPFGKTFDQLFEQRLAEADAFYASLQTPNSKPQTSNSKLQTPNFKLQTLTRQALAGMLWSKQFYHIDMPRWLDGDPGQPPPPESRKTGRNSHWRTLNNADIISMPDKWEYPWYAAWDLAFHCAALARVDARFAKDQLLLFLREWYMHPNGQLPAYEWAFGDVNPPVHAWACLQVFKIDGGKDIDFLKRVFQKLLLNFTWWVNRKDHKGNNVFEGGFLGLDNIGVFDRSSQIPGGGYLEQADGTAWMGMYCLNMLEMALTIAQHDATFDAVATIFCDHFTYIAESLIRIGHDWTGAWDE
ncbi:MAG: glucosidase, partial [Saprospiraceae bacterium]|nr:glucosidase [Saprospiraceae bacterium]